MIAGHAEAARQRAIARLAEAAGDLPEGVAVTRSEQGVVLSGRRLRWMWLRDVRVRGFALAARSRR